MEIRDVGLRGVLVLGWQLSRAICLPAQVGNMDTRDAGPRGVLALGWQLSRAIGLPYSGWEHEH